MLLALKIFASLLLGISGASLVATFIYAIVVRKDEQIPGSLWLLAILCGTVGVAISFFLCRNQLS